MSFLDNSMSSSKSKESRYAHHATGQCYCIHHATQWGCCSHHAMQWCSCALHATEQGCCTHYATEWCCYTHHVMVHVTCFSQNITTFPASAASNAIYSMVGNSTTTHDATPPVISHCILTSNDAFRGYAIRRMPQVQVHQECMRKCNSLFWLWVIY